MKYTIRKQTRSYYFDEEYPLILNDIQASESVPTFTGLLDADGNEIWREPEPLGFHCPIIAR